MEETPTTGPLHTTNGHDGSQDEVRDLREGSTLGVGQGHRPSNVKHPSAPSLMMNAHFAGVGQEAGEKAYEHGIQVIDEGKVFK